MTLPAKAGRGAALRRAKIMRAKRAGSAMRQVRDVLVAQLERSIAGFDKRGASDTAVHDVRKELKRARASLRLMRECVGESVYRRENRLLRDAGRPLRDVRDTKVLLRTFSELKRDERATALGASVAGELKRERHANRERLEHSMPSSGSLRDVRRRIEGIPEAQLDRVPVGSGITHVYKSGLKALAKVRQRSTDERLHEWRKQVKYLFNQIDAVGKLCAGRFAKIHERSRRLGDLLGDDHDLAVLQQKIIQITKKVAMDDHADDLREWLSRAAHRRSVLQKKALKLGRRLYSRKPKRLGAKIDKGLSRDFKPS